MLLQVREHLSVAGKEVISWTPNSCRPEQDQDGGLCYKKCKSGFHGVGPVCWADTENIGIGKPVGLEDCPKGWKNDGLICREPVYNDCSMKGLFGECWGRLRGGNLKGRLDGGGKCPGPGSDGSHVERIDGLCYRKCPAHLPVHVPGMPYLCYKGEGLSYGRGVGTIPSVARLFNYITTKEIIGF